LLSLITSSFVIVGDEGAKIGFFVIVVVVVVVVDDDNVAVVDDIEDVFEVAPSISDG
jgi:hypothetical protein